MGFNYRLILLLLLSSSAMGQSLAPKPSPSNTGGINTLSTFMGGLQSNVYFRPPRSFNCWAQQDSGGMFWFDSANTKTMYYHNGTTRVQMGSGGGTGTVTNVSTGFGMLGGPITTTGTVRVDSNVVLTVARGYKIADSVSLLDSTRLADTSLNLRAVFAADLADSMAVARDSVVKRVPYNGANSNLNMGNYGVTAKRANLDTLEPNSSAGLHLHNTSHQDIFIAGAGGGQNLTIYAPTSFSLMANQNETDTVLGSTSTGLVKKIGIGTTYLKKSDSSLYVTQYRLSDTAAAIRAAIPSVTSYATTSALADSVSGRVTYDDTVGMSNRVNLKLNASDTANNVVTNTSYRTLTNKDVKFRVGGAASYTTSVTIPADSVNVFVITAQSGALLFNAPSGTPTQCQMLLVRIKPTSGTNALTWNAIWRSGDVTLPTTTTAGKTIYMEFLYNSTDSKWDIVGKSDNY